MLKPQTDQDFVARPSQVALDGLRSVETSALQGVSTHKTAWRVTSLGGLDGRGRGGLVDFESMGVFCFDVLSFEVYIPESSGGT